MKRLVISGFLFLGGLILIGTDAIIINLSTADYIESGTALYLGLFLVGIGIIGFITSKYKD